LNKGKKTFGCGGPGRIKKGETSHWVKDCLVRKKRGKNSDVQNSSGGGVGGMLAGKKGWVWRIWGGTNGVNTGAAQSFADERVGEKSVIKVKGNTPTLSRWKKRGQTSTFSMVSKKRLGAETGEIRSGGSTLTGGGYFS